MALPVHAHDVHDWDATEVPILANLPIGGQTREGGDVRQ
jgi:hypothetical protein